MRVKNLQAYYNKEKIKNLMGDEFAVCSKTVQLSRVLN